MTELLRFVRRKPRTVVAALSLLCVFDVARRALSPFFHDLTAMGFHDWDGAASYRYITVLALKGYGELPWWHPTLCGGFSAWGFSEGATNLVSPYLPLYLLAPTPVALRLEVVGSVVTSLFAAGLLASLFTRSMALRALIAIAYSLNGRWALQIASGHSWHMQYAWAPLVLYALHRGSEAGRLRWAAYGGLVLALVAYMGGIYPLPHTALVVVLYALVHGAMTRSFRPLVAATVVGLTALGAAAPKLMAVVDNMSRFPRLVDSPETIGPEAVIQAMTDPRQTFHQGPFRPPMWGWHEWGFYVGWPVVVAMGLALLFASGRKLQAARIVGLLFLVLSLGSFYELAPWALLHRAPAFSSQHVPSRFLFLGVLLVLLAFAGAAEEAFRRWAPSEGRAAAVDLVLLVGVYATGASIAAVDVKATGESFFLRVPDLLPSKEFVQMRRPPFDYVPSESRAGAAYPAMIANVGFVECDLVPSGAQPRGAIPQGDPAYRGEAYLASGQGTARVAAWSPNHAAIDYEGAAPGDVVVYNMNWDPSWRADGEPALDHAHAVAAAAKGTSGRVTFRYAPRTLWPSLAVFVFTMAACFGGPSALARGLRRMRRSPGPLGTPPAGPPKGIGGT